MLKISVDDFRKMCMKGKFSMRVMCLADKKTGRIETFEILDIGFDEDIFEDDPSENRLASGLYMVDYRREYLYIEGLSSTECQSICREILHIGYHDLTRYGEYEVY